MSPAQRASYAADHLSKIPFETSPRPLAGPGDPRHVTHALLAAGWKITSAPGDVRLTLHGPDHTPHRLEIDPLSISREFVNSDGLTVGNSRGGIAGSSR
ncbi:hypothetical protein ACFH04_13660 [Streptomyces noboritoensis]|uniref:Uncharacterized protein n=1 Tax=Streptomyces noboritoensis TaxID=67337 RepID=A0ABV6TG19_9ACTN